MPNQPWMAWSSFVLAPECEVGSYEIFQGNCAQQPWPAGQEATQAWLGACSSLRKSGCTREVPNQPWMAWSSFVLAPKCEVGSYEIFQGYCAQQPWPACQEATQAWFSGCSSLRKSGCTREVPNQPWMAWSSFVLTPGWVVGSYELI